MNPYPHQRDDALYPYFPPRQSTGRFEGLRDGRLWCLHLYDGSRCNRSCSFCVVAGSPKGWHKAFCQEYLDYALALVHPQGCLKFFGGEPTLYPGETVAAAQYLQRNGFEGTFRIYSNGVRAGSLLEILDAVPAMDAVLNYSILHGRGAPAVPESSMRALLGYPGGRICSGHPDIVGVNAPVAPQGIEALHSAGSFGGACARCFPTLRSDGLIHGCPFAVEKTDPHFRLGEAATTEASLTLERFVAFHAWQGEVLEPLAREIGRHPCEVCDRGLCGVARPEGRTKVVADV